MKLSIHGVDERIQYSSVSWVIFYHTMVNGSVHQLIQINYSTFEINRLIVIRTHCVVSVSPSYIYIFCIEFHVCIVYNCFHKIRTRNVRYAATTETFLSNRSFEYYYNYYLVPARCRCFVGSFSEKCR